ncbi:MAG TPA: type I restriction-modification system subunit M N-terminal domain-containing protein [Tepidisphaeraceae bacterium]|jgi:type I restriction-modification system DNA methylase subunit|nr:type I restriction-modification system subunit M N-terminal domain-containing protein [Tepidisphaeraceae bacterium]
MADEKTSELDYADKLWQAADKLRGTVDAAEYKHVVLGYRSSSTSPIRSLLAGPS